MSYDHSKFKCKKISEDTKHRPCSSIRNIMINDIAKLHEKKHNFKTSCSGIRNTIATKPQTRYIFSLSGSEQSINLPAISALFIVVYTDFKDNKTYCYG